MRKVILKDKTKLRALIKSIGRSYVYNAISTKIVIFEDGGWTSVSFSTERRGYYAITVQEIILRAGNRDKIMRTGDYRRVEYFGKNLTKVFNQIEKEVFDFYMSYYKYGKS